eukprot:3044686-Pleurochrysis_carterae.AAC.1
MTFVLSCRRVPIFCAFRSFSLFILLAPFNIVSCSQFESWPEADAEFEAEIEITDGAETTHARAHSRQTERTARQPERKARAMELGAEANTDEEAERVTDKDRNGRHLEMEMETEAKKETGSFIGRGKRGESGVVKNLKGAAR